jgi:hypothetical protein
MLRRICTATDCGPTQHLTMADCMGEHHRHLRPRLESTAADSCPTAATAARKTFKAFEWYFFRADIFFSFMISIMLPRMPDEP